MSAVLWVVLALIVALGVWNVLWMPVQPPAGSFAAEVRTGWYARHAVTKARRWVPRTERCVWRDHEWLAGGEFVTVAEVRRRTDWALRHAYRPVGP